MTVQDKKQKYKHGNYTWWQNARFGMFIHWGLYSVPARHEWVQTYEKVPTEKYGKYRNYFDYDRFEPKEWARLASEAGMKYFVITAKHHEGFCLWNSKYTEYKPERDLLREVIDAFRSEGLHVGLYYSLIDWHHPDFVIDGNHPLCDLPTREKLNRKRDQKKYAVYMRNQVKELLCNYGKIDVIWFDFSYPGKDGKGCDDWESEKLLKLVRSLQPDILINDRLDLEGAGDFSSPEQYVPRDGIRDADGKLLPWEGCQTFSGSWGYHRDELTWKSGKQLIEMLINHVSRGGNLLLNVGPTSRGNLDCRAVNVLQSIAIWMQDNDRAIYGCTIAPEKFIEPENCRYTWNPLSKRLYLHLMTWPTKFVHLKNLVGKLEFARFLHDGSEINFKLPQKNPHGHMTAQTDSETVTLTLPPTPPPCEIPVIELILK